MIHVIISQERRTAPRELALVQDGQLHSMCEFVTNLNDPQIVYAAEWDMVSPFIVVLKGSIADLKLAYAGWPMSEEPKVDNRVDNSLPH
jgi:hypothetical protein